MSHDVQADICMLAYGHTVLQTVLRLDRYCLSRSPIIVIELLQLMLNITPLFEVQVMVSQAFCMAIRIVRLPGLLQVISHALCSLILFHL